MPVNAPAPPANIVRPALITVLIEHTSLALLFPLLFALFRFSTPKSRRRPLFILNLITVCVGIIQGTVSDVYHIHIVLSPLSPWPLALNIVDGFILVIQSILVDLTLFVRLVSVYPPALIGPTSFSLLIAIPVILKLTRVLNIILFTRAMVHALHGPNPAAGMVVVFTTTPYLKIEWAAQWIDNSYASLAFLWKMRQHAGSPTRVLSRASKVSLTECMRVLFRIALANFVIPSIFSVVQFVCVYSKINAQVLNQLVIANVMIATFGVVFATVWAGSVTDRDGQSIQSKPNHGKGHLLTSGDGCGQNQSTTIAASGYSANSSEDLKV